MAKREIKEYKDNVGKGRMLESVEKKRDGFERGVKRVVRQRKVVESERTER